MRSLAAQRCRVQRPRGRRPFSSCRRTRTCTPAAVATEQALLSKLVSKGASFPKAELSISIDTNQPLLVASDDVKAGETLISVPEDVWLTPDAAQRSSIGSLIGSLEPWLQIALWILAEGSDPASAIHAYTASLPASLDSPLFWSTEELQELQGTQLLESTQAYTQFFQQRYEQLQQELLDAHPATFPADKFSYDRFLWAVAAVRSRTHPPLEGAEIALVPGTDLVQHRKGCSNSLKVVRGGFLGRSRVLVLEAGRSLRRGEALTLDFAAAGQKLDSLVLLDHGVLDPLSPPGGYQLTVTIPETDRNLDDKLDILESVGMGQSASFRLAAEDEPSDEMMAFLRLMQLRKQDTFLLESIFRGEVWGHMQMPVSDFNERLVCEAMAAGARQALAGYPTSLEDDVALLRGGSARKGSRLETALLVRLGEKEALDATLQYFEGRMSQLRTLEYYGERRLKRLGLMDEKGRTTWDGMFKDSIA